MMIRQFERILHEHPGQPGDLLAVTRGQLAQVIAEYYHDSNSQQRALPEALQDVLPKLAPLERSVVTVLAEQMGEYVTAQQLLDRTMVQSVEAVWTLCCRLKKKLAQTPGVRLRSERWSGYCLEITA